MATPSKKHPVIERMLERYSGRTTAITNDRCLDSPVGCGKPAMEFRDQLGEKEYRVSGWCQSCQDKVFHA